VVVRFPWGIVLAIRCGSMAAPLDCASGGRRLAAPPSSSIVGCPHCDPGHSRGQEGGAVDEAVSFTSFDRSTRGAPLDRRLFSVEDANSPWTFSGLVEPSPNTVDL